MISIDYRNPQPIYEQLICAFSDMILRGIMKADEQLPSVRQISKELTVNPNTVQKAYNELERRKIIYSIPGRGSFVSPDTDRIKRLHREELTEKMTSLMREASAAGLERSDAEAIIKQVWGDKNDQDR